ncbi:alpha/beta hydrolase [uncultured Jatrophihabitans sp.]|uniref:alpha/beta hydrolase n=1 Tax=uncultured Jatrophihabitans sp. TaxID=1610747 RepID=UPI0035CC2E0C
MSAGRTVGVLLAAFGVVAGALTGCSSSSPARPVHRTTQSAHPGSPAAPARGTSDSGTPSASAVNTTVGTVLTRAIPGGSSGFKPRQALIYLPPAARSHPHERFPVLVLLHGTPGAPTRWINAGNARATLNAFAAAHSGRAPVVVMPDVNGSEHADTECIRTTYGADVEKYLLDVVPAWILAHLPVTRDRARWGIAGLSEGGTCALMLGLRGTPGWGFVGDFSGLKRPTVGPTDDMADTVKELFGGSESAYDAHDPSLLLARHRYPHLAVWFECGNDDGTVLNDQSMLARLARRTVGAVKVATVPGGHTWKVWQESLRSTLPWFWTHSG